jgi:hypothetical protein
MSSKKEEPFPAGVRKTRDDRGGSEGCFLANLECGEKGPQPRQVGIF